MIKQKVMAAAGGWDETMLDSLYDLIYRVPNLTVDNVDTKQPIPVSFMRSVGSTASVFFLESFIDELANAANSIPTNTAASYSRTTPARSPSSMRSSPPPDGKRRLRTTPIAASHSISTPGAVAPLRRRRHCCGGADR